MTQRNVKTSSSWLDNPIRLCNELGRGSLAETDPKECESLFETVSDAARTPCAPPGRPRLVTRPRDPPILIAVCRTPTHCFLRMKNHDSWCNHVSSNNNPLIPPITGSLTLSSLRLIHFLYCGLATAFSVPYPRHSRRQAWPFWRTSSRNVSEISERLGRRPLPASSRRSQRINSPPLPKLSSSGNHVGQQETVLGWKNTGRIRPFVGLPLLRSSLENHITCSSYF